MSRAPAGKVRLQKFLSEAGVASRRRAEELILGGRVLVNNEVVDALPAFVDPQQDRVVADGTPVRAQRLEYFLVHKPKGVVCTNRDPAGRLRAVDLLPDLPMRLVPVGRLDADSTGLLIMTNDGELAQRITHPRYGIPKTYRAEVRGRVFAELPAQMRAGVHLSEGRAYASDVRVVHSSHQRSALLITLREGRNRQIRRMLARLGHPVKKLTRVQIGPLSLRGLPMGGARRLTRKELDALHAELERLASTAEGTPREPRKARTRLPRKRTTSGTQRGSTRSAPDSRSPRGRTRRSSTEGGKPQPKRRLIT